MQEDILILFPPVEIWADRRVMAEAGKLKEPSEYLCNTVNPMSLPPFSSSRSRCRRRVDNAHSIDFEGRNSEISATLRKSVVIVYHPNRQFWVVEHPLLNVWLSILERFTL